MRTRVFKSYSDPSHGWLKVPKKLLRELGIDKLISRYSYMRGEYAFLEEDYDCSLFIRNLKAKGIPFRIDGSHGNKRSRIRNYQPYWGE